jgi:hypothetical protein
LVLAELLCVIEEEDSADGLADFLEKDEICWHRSRVATG